LGFVGRRISSAAAGLVSAAILTGLPISAWSQSGSEVAMANPRIKPFDGDSVALPRPLSTSEAQLMRRLFADQAAGVPVSAADMKVLGEGALLRGTLLADRFLRQPSRAPVPGLRAWLRRYDTQPEAPAIRSLLAAKAPHQKLPPLDNAGVLPASQIDVENLPVNLDQSRSAALDRDVHEAALRGRTDTALRIIARRRGIRPEYAAQLRAEVAQTLLARGEPTRALELALVAQRQSGGKVGLASFIAGLAEWRGGRPETAAKHFQAASSARLSSPSMRAAAAFWAARAKVRAGDSAAYRPWMQRAAAEPRTFYGLLARRALGMGIGFSAETETLGQADVEAIGALPAGQRAFALLQIGRTDAAEAELRTIWPMTARDAALGQSLLLVARAAGLTGLVAQLASLEQAHDGRLRDDARFPLPPLAPHGGFQVDPALVYALIRLESNFDPTAVSSVGASGLMQVMPMTATYMAKKGMMPSNAASRLREPALNMEIGQRYIQFLSRQPAVSGDLIRLLASYNAGPTNLAKWTADGAASADPLLFIETIPFNETRGFVQNVLAYSWLYAARLELPAHSLNELAAGAWPRFYEAEPATGWRMARLH